MGKMNVTVLSQSHHTSIFVEPAKISAGLNEDYVDNEDDDDDEDDFGYRRRHFEQEQVNCTVYCR